MALHRKKVKPFDVEFQVHTLTCWEPLSPVEWHILFGCFSFYIYIWRSTGKGVYTFQNIWCQSSGTLYIPGFWRKTFCKSYPFPVECHMLYSFVGASLFVIMVHASFLATNQAIDNVEAGAQMEGVEVM